VAPPFISFPEGTTAQPFTLYYREGDVIRSLSNAPGATPQVFLDPLAEFGHYLPPRREYVPEWGALSPDGRTMALVLTDDPISKMPPGASDAFSPAPHPVSIYLMDMVTRELRLLVPEGFIPVWSPDSQRLAYRSTQTWGLWVADVATGEAREVYAVSGEHFVSQFAWASDNRQLSLTDVVLYYTDELFIVDAEDLTPPRVVVPGRTYGLSLAQWSPVSQQLALIMTGPTPQYHEDLWLMNSDGTAARQLTHDLRVLGGLPQWSPDGRWIAFSAVAIYEAELSQYDLWLIDPVSAELRRLTFEQSVTIGDDLANDTMPSWSPDGTQLVFFKTSSQLWVMSLIDGSRRPLVQNYDNLYDSGLIVGP
jgi:Tol biopolymer transport system component